MEKYSNGKIYCLSYNNLYYIGSTYKTLDERVKLHIKDFKYSKPKTNSYKIINLSMNFKSYIIEHYSCNSRKELEKREGFYIKKYKKLYGNNCVNKNIAGRTSLEYCNDPINKQKKTEYDKIYRKENKKQIKIGKVNHREKNKKETLKKEAKYREDNRKLIRQNDKIKYEWKKIFGGDVRYNNNLLQISMDLFN